MKNNIECNSSYMYGNGNVSDFFVKITYISIYIGNVRWLLGGQ